MFSDDRSAMERSKLLTQVTAAVLQTCEASLGVYWGNATLVIQPKLFREFAVEVLPSEPPIPIWIDFRVGPGASGKMSAFTCGLRALGHMEIETENSPEQPGDLRSRLMDLSQYLLENGPVINDGDTVGQDANERIRVKYAPSAFGYEEKVMRLDYESLKTKRGWFGRQAAPHRS